MDRVLSFDEVEELIPEYVLGTLEPDEMLAVEQYLRSQRALMERLGELEQAVVQLAYAAPTRLLPDGPKEQLMARVRADAATGSTTAREESDRPMAPAPARTGASQARGSQTLRSLFPWPAAAAAAILMLALLGLYTLQVLGQVNQVTAERAELQNQVAQLEQRNQALQQQLEARELQLALLARADLTVSLPATDAAPGASGLFYQGNGESSVILYGLDALPEAQTYQLWWITAEGVPLPADLLVAEGELPAWQQVSAAPPEEELAAIGVTIEPAGGSAEPTGPILLLGEVN
jgi:anti-sigma-K factor RskA